MVRKRPLKQTFLPGKAKTLALFFSCRKCHGFSLFTPDLHGILPQAIQHFLIEIIQHREESAKKVGFTPNTWIRSPWN